MPRIKDITDHHASITPVDRAKYQAIYRSQNPSKNGIDAQTAKNLFLKSKLSNEQLAQIWYALVLILIKKAFINMHLGIWLIFVNVDI